MANIKQEIEKRRTFAIISHPDAGKTTLTEKFLLYGGAINLAGSVKGKATARHAVSENQRTLRAVECLQKNNIEEFGKLMNESHISLRTTSTGTSLSGCIPLMSIILPSSFSIDTSFTPRR